MVLYLLESKHLLYHYINLPEDFSDEIRSNHICFDQMRPNQQPDIDEIIIYYKIVKKELFGKNEVYNNKKHAV